ncbi:TonB-dependent receptor [Novosphingobium beihaiensis]|uniref:TonB-dependent receptor n=1 Tax=Novosphingobium beihaiensis TaxID=2930389 RepID=A0ABT0BRK6_9SPHN|nr:TonB-dependent receptor [Novosphingobium beihaiensis]MCJ2187613.1 TonB-dependent receptor [Novosphingobium beihaiensis]
MQKSLKIWMTTSALVAPVFVSPAAAQEAPQESASVVYDSTTGKGAPADGLGDIIVTAQKRSETSQKTPAAVTAVNSETLVARGVTTLSSVEKLVPSAKFAVQGSETQVFIRGVGSQVGNPNIPESVATQLNGVFLPRYTTGAGLFDVAQVEVLPGPQGTLYGRSAVGGVVNVNTRRPGWDFGVQASLEKGNYDSTVLNGGIDVPLNDSVAVRGAVYFDKHDGYNNNGTYDKNALAGRLSVLIEPTGTLSAFLWGSYYRGRSKPSPLQYVPYPAGGPYDYPETDPASAFAYPPDGLATDYGKTRYRSWQFGGQIDLDLGAVSVTYIPGYIYARDVTARSIVGFKQDSVIGYKQLSNEVRVSSNNGSRLKWMVGFSQSHQSSPFYFVFGPNFGGVDMVVKMDALAGYGEATYSVTDSVRLTAGARYSWDKLAADNAEAFFPNPDFSRGILSYDYSNSWKRFNWKLGVEADAGPQSLVYANVQTGFNPGTFQVSAPLQGENIDPQKMIGFTLGSKNRFFDNRLQLNLEAFYYRYRDQIVQAYDVGTGGTELYNAPHSRMYGVQLDGAFAVTPTTKLNLSASTLNAKLRTFVVDLLSGGTADYSGLVLPYSPKLTLSAGLEQTVPLASGAQFRFRADTSYNSGYWDTFSHQPDLRQKRFSKTDVSLTYTTADRRFDVSVWGRNLENEATHAAAGETGRPYPNAGAVYVEPPRTYGVTLRANL